jgi:hypothetical protein
MRKLILVMGVVCVSSPAWAIDKYLELEPPDTRATFGTGYDSLRREFVPQECVSFGKARVAGGGGGDIHDMSLMSSKQRLAQAMGVGVNASFQASMGVASASASDKLGFFQATETHLLAITVLAHYQRVEPVQFIQGDITLKPEFKSLDKATFREKCGDYLIIGTQSGREFFGSATLRIDDEQTLSKMVDSAHAGFDYAFVSGQVGVDYLQKMKEASSSKDLEIHVQSTGTNRIATTMDGLIKEYQGFPTSKTPARTIKLIAIPYEKIVVDWPKENVLAPPTDEDMLGDLATAAWNLISLDEDARFVLDHRDVFAAGTTEKKRHERFAWLEERDRWYQAQLASLRAKAKDCDVNFDHACKALWDAWHGFDPAREYDHFPVPRTSDCYSPIEIKGTDIASALFKPSQDTPHPLGKTTFTHVGHGDTEMSSGPVSVDAKLTFAVDYSGGKKSAARQLMASLTVLLEEMVPDHTAFRGDATGQVIDLAQPKVGQPSYAQCAFRGDGVKAPKRDGYHGSIKDRADLVSDTTTGTFRANAWGVLSSIHCTVDGPTGDDGNDIACDAVDIKNVQLDLVNSADLAADKWVAPRTSKAPAAQPPPPAPGAADPDTEKALRAALAPRAHAGRSATCEAGTTALPLSSEVVCAPKAIR